MLICVYVGPYMYLRMCARHMLPKFKMSQTYSNNIYLTIGIHYFICNSNILTPKLHICTGKIR